MKIARFMGYPINKVSSLERFIHKQANEIAKNGHDMHIIYDGGKNSKASAIAEKLSPNTIIIYDYIYARNHWKFIIDYIRYLYRAYFFIRNGRYDIVHAYFDPSARLLNILAPLFRRTKFIRTMGGVPNYEKETNFLGRIKKKYYLFKLLNYDKIICVSEAVRDALLKYNVKPDRLAIIYDAVDTNYFNRYYINNKISNAFNLSFCGRLEKVKNIDCLIRGLRILRQKIKVKDICLNIYGTGSKYMQLQRLAKQENVEQNVIFHGLIHNVVKILNEKTDIYVQASFSEGLSASILEAMSCECPVVASNIGGHRTMIRDGINGLLFDPQSPIDFSKKIHKLITSESLRKNIGYKARQTMIGSFDINERIKSENKIYQSLIKKNEKISDLEDAMKI